MQVDANSPMPEMITADQLLKEIMEHGPNKSTTANSQNQGNQNTEKLGHSESLPATSPKKNEDVPTGIHSDLVILDCQGPSDYQDFHIRGAINVSFPAIMMRRIAAGKIDILEKFKELKAKVSNTQVKFVVYDSYVPSCEYLKSAEDLNECSTLNLTQPRGSSLDVVDTANKIDNDTIFEKTGNNAGDAANCSSFSTTELSDLVYLVAKKLMQSGCHVVILKGKSTLKTC